MSEQLRLFDLDDGNKKEDEREKQKKKEPVKTVEPDMALEYAGYWWACRQMMNEYMEFVRVSKFRLNTIYLEKVPDELELAYKKCYKGDVRRLDGHVSRQESKLMAAIAAYQANCQKFAVEAVDLNWLISHLWENAPRRRGIRDKCERRAKNPTKYPLTSLKDL